MIWAEFKTWTAWCQNTNDCQHQFLDVTFSVWKGIVHICRQAKCLCSDLKIPPGILSGKFQWLTFFKITLSLKINSYLPLFPIITIFITAASHKDWELPNSQNQCDRLKSTLTMVWIFPSRVLTFCTEKVANLNLYKNIDYFLLNGSAKQTLANLSSAHVNSQAKCLPVHVQTSHIKRIKLFFFVRAVARNRPTEALVSVISFFLP